MAIDEYEPETKGQKQGPKQGPKQILEIPRDTKRDTKQKTRFLGEALMERYHRDTKLFWLLSL